MDLSGRRHSVGESPTKREHGGVRGPCQLVHPVRCWEMTSKRIAVFRLDQVITASDALAESGSGEGVSEADNPAFEQAGTEESGPEDGFLDDLTGNARQTGHPVDHHPDRRRGPTPLS